MIELYLTKVTENSEREQAGKLYARVSYKESMTFIHITSRKIKNIYDVRTNYRGTTLLHRYSMLLIT